VGKLRPGAVQKTSRGSPVSPRPWKSINLKTTDNARDVKTSWGEDLTRSGGCQQKGSVGVDDQKLALRHAVKFGKTSRWQGSVQVKGRKVNQRLTNNKEKKKEVHPSL